MKGGLKGWNVKLKKNKCKKKAFKISKDALYLNNNIIHTTCTYNSNVFQQYLMIGQQCLKCTEYIHVCTYI